jgi:hypothetical protein
VVQTSERRPYSNFILQKGTLGPDGTDLKPKFGPIDNTVPIRTTLPPLPSPPQITSIPKRRNFRNQAKKK